MLVVLKSVAESREDSAHFHTNPKLSYGFIFSRSSGTHEKLTFPFPVLFPRDIIFYYHINASTRFKFPSWFAESHYPSFHSRPETAVELFIVIVVGWKTCYALILNLTMNKSDLFFSRFFFSFIFLLFSASLYTICTWWINITIDGNDN